MDRYIFGHIHIATMNKYLNPRMFYPFRSHTPIPYTWNVMPPISVASVLLECVIQESYRWGCMLHDLMSLSFFMYFTAIVHFSLARCTLYGHAMICLTIKLLTYIWGFLPWPLGKKLLLKLCSDFMQTYSFMSVKCIFMHGISVSWGERVSYCI